MNVEKNIDFVSTQHKCHLLHFFKRKKNWTVSDMRWRKRKKTFKKREQMRRTTMELGQLSSGLQKEECFWEYHVCTWGCSCNVIHVQCLHFLDLYVAITICYQCSSFNLIYFSLHLIYTFFLPFQHNLAKTIFVATDFYMHFLGYNLK